MPVEVTAEKNLENVTLPLASAFDITGTVEFEGVAAGKYPSVTVALSPEESLALGRPPDSKIGPDGSFRLSGVTPGIWYLSLEPLPEGLWIKSATYGDADVTGGQLRASDSPRGPLHIVLAANGARISGKVAENEQPHKATVVLAPASDEQRRSVHLFQATVPRPAGLLLVRC
jgi:hypothetical protein